METTTQAQPQPLDQWDQTIERCAAAYRRVRAELKKGALSWSSDAQENQHEAYRAFAAQLPILRDPYSIHLYIACIGNGVSIGAIDIADAGRFCHIANTAVSIWKLSNITLPAAEAKQQEAEQKAKQKAQARSVRTPDPQAQARGADTPLPPKGNHSQEKDGQFAAQQREKDENKEKPLPSKGNQVTEEQLEKALQHALDNLPRFEIQKQHFQLLRNRGMSLPSDSELRDNPLAALHLCRTAEQIIIKEAVAAISPTPQQAKEQPKDQQEPPAQAA